MCFHASTDAIFSSKLTDDNLSRDKNTYLTRSCSLTLHQNQSNADLYPSSSSVHKLKKFWKLAKWPCSALIALKLKANLKDGHYCTVHVWSNNECRLGKSLKWSRKLAQLQQRSWYGWCLTAKNKASCTEQYSVRFVALKQAKEKLCDDLLELNGSEVKKAQGQTQLW